jgi:alanine-glyoxylate transaminase/serine-glyoxylate transaminase/serine-pyruvate transaminase
MNPSNGRIHRALPGPSVIPDQVLQAMQRPAPNIYGGELENITKSILDDIATFAGSVGRVALYISNGHGAWEAAISNLFRKNDFILVISTGVFGKKWGKIAEKLGINVIYLDYGMEKTFEFDDLIKEISKDKKHNIKGVLAVQTDTATSIRTDMKKISTILKDHSHPALFLVDSIACFGCDDMLMDDWGIDVLITASQKGLMTPPGLSYLVINAKAEDYAKGLNEKSAYWDWGPRLDPTNFYEIYFGTAPTHLLFAQKVALDIIKAEGKLNIMKRHEVLAKAVWKAIDIWQEEGPLRFNVADEKDRSNAVTTVVAKNFDLLPLREWIELNCGVELGIGIGFDSTEYLNGKSAFRIAHMGHLNPHMLLGVLASIETGLIASKISFKKGGLDNAMDFLGKAITD